MYAFFFRRPSVQNVCFLTESRLPGKVCILCLDDKIFVAGPLVPSGVAQLVPRGARGGNPRQSRAGMIYLLWR